MGGMRTDLLELRGGGEWSGAAPVGQHGHGGLWCHFGRLSRGLPVATLCSLCALINLLAPSTEGFQARVFNVCLHLVCVRACSIVKCVQDFTSARLRVDTVGGHLGTCRSFSRLGHFCR